MIIKKMYQGSVPENKIMSAYSDSQTDTYSCDYINNIAGGGREALTAYLPYSQTTTSTDEKVKLGLYNQIGTKLSMSNNGIKIGEGISKVKVSGVISFVWDSPKTLDVNIKILKNDTPILRINGNKVEYGGDSVVCPPVLIDVQEGDVIYMNVVSNISGNILYMYMNSTFLTVEAVSSTENIDSTVNYVDNELIATPEFLNGKRIYAYRFKFTQALTKNTPYDFNLPFADRIDYAWVDVSQSFLDNSKAVDNYNVWSLAGGYEGYGFRLGIAGKNIISIMADSDWGANWTYTIMVKCTLK